MLLWSGRLWGFHDSCTELHGLLLASELQAPPCTLKMQGALPLSLSLSLPRR